MEKPLRLNELKRYTHLPTASSHAEEPDNLLCWLPQRGKIRMTHTFSPATWKRGWTSRASSLYV